MFLVAYDIITSYHSQRQAGQFSDSGYPPTFSVKVVSHLPLSFNSPVSVNRPPNYLDVLPVTPFDPPLCSAYVVSRTQEKRGWLRETSAYAHLSYKPQNCDKPATVKGA